MTDIRGEPYIGRGEHQYIAGYKTHLITVASMVFFTWLSIRYAARIYSRDDVLFDEEKPRESKPGARGWKLVKRSD